VKETFTSKKEYPIMAKTRFKPEQIIHMLREAEVRLAGGSTIGEVCRALAISEQSYYRWRKEYVGMQVSQAKKLKDLERENALLKKLVADQALDKAILEEEPQGKLLSPERRRQAVSHIKSMLRLSERRACKVIGQPRSTQRRVLVRRDDETFLTRAFLDLATESSMVDMATAASQPCSGTRAGT
jgi:predicted transcriptional regulator